MTISLGPLDYAILSAYFLFVVAVGWMVRRRVRTSEDFLTSHRSVPLWITSLAFLAANLGAQEVMGMCASGAKYGLMTVHFYWVGAIPAMMFVGVFMMPFYYGSRARSVPEFLKLRFDEKTRALNAASFAVMTVFSSGISLYALGKLFQLLLGWSFEQSVLLSAAVVLVYTFLGGLTSAIYNEVLQFFLIVIGFTPLAIMAVNKAGGWAGMSARLPPVMVHAWKYTGSAADNPMGVRSFRIAGGSGIRAVLRILVHRLPGGAARHGGELDVGRAAHSADRGVSKDGDAVHRDSAGHRRHGAYENECGLLAAGQGCGIRLRSGAHHHDGSLLPVRPAGPGTHRADGFVHERDGGECDCVQYRFHLRPVSELHSQERTRRSLSACRALDHADRRGALDRSRLHGAVATTTSWTCCSWCSPS